MEDCLDVVIVGGGAAGFFTAINLAEQQPQLKIRNFESKRGITKVKISGGGRCNVNHAEFIPKNYGRILSARQQRTSWSFP